MASITISIVGRAVLVVGRLVGVLADMWTRVIETLGGKASAGGYLAMLLAVLSFIVQFATLEKSKTDYAFEVIKEDNAYLRKENSGLRIENISLQQDLMERDASLNILTATRGDEPIIAWAKDREGRYIEFNRAFEEQVLIPQGLDPHDALFHTDLELWSDTARSRIYRQHDLEVMRTRKRKKFYEKMKFDGTIVPYVSEKYPLILMNRVVGTGGQAYEDCR
jgi:PAS domain-containing protein